MGYEGLKFGSLDEAIKVDDLICLMKAKEYQRRSLIYALNEAKNKEVSTYLR